MKHLLFDEPAVRMALLPLTFTRPVACLRIGMLTIAEKWRHFLQQPPGHVTEPYLQAKYEGNVAAGDLLLNGAVCPDQALAQAVSELPAGQVLAAPDGTPLALRPGIVLATPEAILAWAASAPARPYTLPFDKVRTLSDVFLLTGPQLRADFARVTQGRQSQPVTDRHTLVYNAAQVFLEPGARTRACVLNAENGPIYLGPDAEVQEGSLIRGPFALGTGSVVALGAKMRGDIAVGPYCKVGGEISNSVLMGHSNKGHEGYLGNSVLGEWCNLGADTNTSNLKNDYGTVKQWHYGHNAYMDTGRQFVGLVMGDHSKAGINTMFNTGTVVGVSANVFGGDFPPRHVPSFTWGGAAGLDIYRLDKALAVAERVLQRRQLCLDQRERDLLAHVFQLTHGGKKPIGFQTR